MPSRPKVYCCAPVPVYRDNYGIRSDLLHGVFEPIIRETAKKAYAPLIDCYTPLKDQKGITTDGVHPSVKGMQAIAAVAYKALLERDPPVARVAELAQEWQQEEAKQKAETEERRAVLNTLAVQAKTEPRVVLLTPDAVRNMSGW
jgi:hypothetical protein